MLNRKITNTTSREKRAFYDMWFKSIGELILCKKCGYENKQYNPVLGIVASSIYKYGSKRTCSRCAAPMPWLDDRTYGKNERRGTDMGLIDPHDKLYHRVTVWSMKDPPSFRE